MRSDRSAETTERVLEGLGRAIGASGTARLSIAELPALTGVAHGRMAEAIGRAIRSGQLTIRPAEPGHAFYELTGRGRQ